MKALFKRTITAVILIIGVILGILLLPNLLFSLIVGIVLSIAAWEWLSLIGIAKVSKQAIFLGLLWLVFGLGMFMPAPLLLTVSLLWWVMAAFWVWFYPRCKLNNVITHTGGQFLMLLVFVPCLVGFSILHSIAISQLFMVLLIVWATDTGGYFFGVRYGKHKLLPNVSPKKSVEGLIGGVLLAVIVSIIWAVISHFSYSIWYLLLVVLTSLFSVIGDLFESMIKRITNHKDSGTLLPGHGGLYDRIDSLTAAVPIYTLGLFFLYH